MNNSVEDFIRRKEELLSCLTKYVDVPTVDVLSKFMLDLEMMGAVDVEIRKDGQPAYKLNQDYRHPIRDILDEDNRLTG